MSDDVVASDPETDKLVQFFKWAATKGYASAATPGEGGRLAEAFLAGWAQADERAARC